MTAKSSILLNMAVKKGMIPAEKAEKIRATLDTTSAPLDWLLENQHVTVAQAEDLRKGAMDLLREEDLSGKKPGTESSVLPTPGQKIGPYELIEKLGSGGMGIVYSARDTRLDRTVAIKILHRAENPNILARFKREAKAMARLKHPRIVNIFDVGEDHDRPYLVMEMYQGTSLEEALNEKRLSRKNAIDVIRQAAVGVSFANKNGVFHRDLKPANILVTPRTEGIVMDFGLAKLSEGQEQTLSVEGSVLGTPAYMSPEQATGNLDKVDRRTDVWGLGATLYHALSGEPPFTGKSVHEVLKAIVDTDPPSLREKDPTIHADLVTVCSKALEKDPGDRYHSATDFARDLRMFLSGKPITATPPSAIHRVQKWVSRKRRILLASAGGLLLALTATIVLAEISRSNRFDRLKEDTITAYDEKNWARVIANGEEATRIREDAELEKLLITARAMIDRDREQREKQSKTISKQAALENLRKKILPLEEKVREARVHFYAKGVDIQSKLASVEDSLRELESLLEKEKEYRSHSLGWKTVGMGWFFLGDPVRAETALLTARKLDPNDGGVRQHLGRIYLQRSLEALRTKEVSSMGGRRALSERWALQATELLEEKGADAADRDEFEYLLARAYLTRAKGDLAQLKRTCEKALSKYSNRLGAEEFTFLLGTGEQGSDAIEKFTAVIERAPNHSRAYYERGMSRARGGDYLEGIKDLDQAIRINPRSIWSYISRGIVWRRIGENKKALENFAKGLEFLTLHEPIYEMAEKNLYGQVLAGRIHREMAVLYMEDNDLEKALRELDLALELNGEDALSYMRRGNLFRRQSEWNRAMEDYRKVIDLAEKSGKSSDKIRKISSDLERKIRKRQE